jgi:hypothetical protein
MSLSVRHDKCHRKQWSLGHGLRVIEKMNGRRNRTFECRRDRKALAVASDGGNNASGRRFDDVLQIAQPLSATIYTIASMTMGIWSRRPFVSREFKGLKWTLAAQELRRTFRNESCTSNPPS